MKEVETMYRQGIKSAMSVRESVNNEIVYLESGEFPLEIRIAASQLKFWKSIRLLQQQNPDHYISKLVTLGENTNYIKYYKNLEETYIDPSSCSSTMRNTMHDSFVNKVRGSAESDPDSKLGSYLRVNPQFVIPTLNNMLEFS